MNNKSFHAPEGHKRLTINLRDDLHKKLKLVAVETECTATDLIQRFIEEMLNQSVASWLVIKKDEKSRN
jgi:predicted transcriptional regulator